MCVGCANPLCSGCERMAFAMASIQRCMDMAPKVKEFDGGAVFKGYGNSHFTLDKNGYHVTTEIGGLKQKERIFWHDDVD